MGLAKEYETGRALEREMLEQNTVNVNHSSFRAIGLEL